MHAAVDLDRLLQFLVSAAEEMTTAFLNLIRSTSSAFLSAALNYGSNGWDNDVMIEVAAEVPDYCAWCSLTLGRQLGGSEMVNYCSESCRNSHCNSEHEIKYGHTKSPHALRGGKVSPDSAVRSSETAEQSNKILFPYEKFVRFFNLEKPGYPPCGLKNCGNSCFANAALQCLAYTRPLAAYFLEENHKIECQMDTWCFLCAFQTHMERVSWSHTSFIPINILSRLHDIGGNLEHGKEEDAHEFMRFAIDKMQSVFLNEFAGEMAGYPSYQETSLVQHIFGGCLKSQVICGNCNNVSIQFEHMMDLTVEINGDAESLEECLNKFTSEELLHGDNMYKCDSCSTYVVARKRLLIQQAPNILTIALKRFENGRFDHLNKRVTFPETLDLRSYVNELEDGNDVYKLYAIIVHVGNLSASFCGHYICYVKDFGGNWYKVDDDKVSAVDLNEVLSQGAYMLLYSRICARPSSLHPAALLKEQENNKLKIQTVDLSAMQPVDTSLMPTAKCSEVEANCGVESYLMRSTGHAGEEVEMESHNSDGFNSSAKEGVFPSKLHHYKASAGYDFEDELQYYQRDTNEGLLRKRYLDSGSATSCSFEKDRRQDTCSFTAGEGPKENSASYTDMLGNSEREGNEPLYAKLNPILACDSIGRGLRNRASEAYSPVFLDNDSKDAAAQIPIGLSCEVKLKPLSALGGKRRRELFKQQNEVSVALTPRNRIHLNHWLLAENGSYSKYE